MKTTVTVAHSVSHTTTVSVKVTVDGVSSSWSEKCSSAGIAAAVTRIKAKAIENLTTVQAALEQV